MELGNRGWKVFEQSDRKYKLIYFLEQTVSRNMVIGDAVIENSEESEEHVTGT